MNPTLSAAYRYSEISYAIVTGWPEKKMSAGSLHRSKMSLNDTVIYAERECRRLLQLP